MYTIKTSTERITHICTKYVPSFAATTTYNNLLDASHSLVQKNASYIH